MRLCSRVRMELDAGQLGFNPVLILVSLVLVLPWVVADHAHAAGILTVSTRNDVVNGDVSSPNALKTNPGPDGISLREAILATNAVPGPNTISFSSRSEERRVGKEGRLWWAR